MEGHSPFAQVIPHLSEEEEEEEEEQPGEEEEGPGEEEEGPGEEEEGPGEEGTGEEPCEEDPGEEEPGDEEDPGEEDAGDDEDPGEEDPGDDDDEDPGDDDDEDPGDDEDQDHHPGASLQVRRSPGAPSTSSRRPRLYLRPRPPPAQPGPSHLQLPWAHPGAPGLETSSPEPGEAATPGFVQLIDERGVYSTAKLVLGGRSGAPGEAENDDEEEEDGAGKEEEELPAHLEIRQVIVADKPFQCPACHKSFKRTWELLSHQVVHTEARPFTCHLCRATFKRHSDFKSHALVHTEERPHRCDLCGKRFKRSSNLQEHRRIHSGQRPFTCPRCAKSFKTPYERQRHALTHLAAEKKTLQVRRVRQGFPGGQRAAAAPAAQVRGQAAHLRRVREALHLRPLAQGARARAHR
ncbi:zinc finger protein 629-like [Camarhynchus parvulus]|uniref:zinc finger protein 629-like n=1 Tax=Geospiza parvula TaxID=87175 RepID=UPI001237C1D6|nr:zinc finger protein 629-like [Camarhynchus parvulus]